MTAEVQSPHLEPSPFTTPLPADVYGTSDGVRTGLSGWQDFDWFSTSVMAMMRWIPPVTKREGRRPTGVSTVTGPSGVTVFPNTLDATKDTEDGMAALAIAADAGDEATFLRAANEIDWLQRPATDFVRSVRLALAAGAHLFARNLAAEGARLYPDHSELQKMAHILAPPRVVKTNLPSSPSLPANQAWLRAHANEYKGQWVALRNGSPVAIASTARELRERLDSTADLMVTRVF